MLDALDNIHIAMCLDLPLGDHFQLPPYPPHIQRMRLRFHRDITFGTCMEIRRVELSDLELGSTRRIPSPSVVTSGMASALAAR